MVDKSSVDARAKHAAEMRAWREKNSEHYKAYRAQWRLSNAAHLKEYGRQRYEESKDHQKARATQWQKDHPERVRLQWKVAPANRRYPGTITVDDVVAVLKRCGRVCCWCGKSDLRDRDFTLEHLKPFNSRDCLAIACRSCNSKKFQRESKGQSPEARERSLAAARQRRRDNPELFKEKDRASNAKRKIRRQLQRAAKKQPA